MPKLPPYQQYACVHVATPAVVGNIISLKCGHPFAYALLPSVNGSNQRKAG